MTQINNLLDHNLWVNTGISISYRNKTQIKRSDYLGILDFFLLMATMI